MKPHRLSTAVISQISLAAILVIATGLSVQAQTWTQYDQGTPPQHAAGVSPVGSYLSTDLGTVNLSNGSLNLSLPMGSAGGRGFTIPIALNYSSKVWSVAHESVLWPWPHDMDVDMAYARYAAGDTEMDLFNRVAPGWVVGGMPLLKRQSISFPGCQSYSLYGLNKLTVVLPDKGEIELRDDLTDGAPLYMGCTPNGEYRGQRWHATDGSGIVFISDVDNGVALNSLAGTLITGDGMRYRFTNVSGLLGRASSVTDRNGNQITINYSTDQTGKITTEYIDQLGRSTKVEQHAPDPANGSVILALLVTLKGYQGTPQYYKVKTEALSNHIRSDFNYNGQQILTGYNDRFGYCYAGGQPPAANYLFPDSYCGYQERIDTQPAVSQVILPDGRALQFSYNLYGEVAEVTLPTGGKLQYDYTGFTYTGFPSGNTLPGEYQGQMNAVPNIDRAVTARRTYPDGITLEETSTYLFGPQTVNGSSSACTEVKAYAGTSAGTLLSDQRHFFLPAGRYLTGSHGSMSGTGYSLWSTGVEWRTEVLDAAGAVISASEQDWAQRTPVSWSSGYTQEQPANDNRVSEARRYLDDGSFAKTDTFYDNTNYPRANNVSEVKEYDFDQSLKRRTTMSYVTGSYQTDDAIHLVSLVQQQSIYDGSGTNEVARTVNEYDVYASDGNHALLQDYGTVIGHDNAYGLNKVTRGNLTATGRWLKSNNTTIYSYLRYDTLGNPVANKDANGNVTTISYADDFGDGSNPGAGSNGNNGATFALPTLITSPPPTPGAPVHTARTQYDFWSGLLTGFKDRNGVITQTIYSDPFSRPTLVKSALGTGVEVHAAMYYAPTTAFGTTLTNNDVLTAKDQTTVNDATLRSWTHTDGFGRTVETWSRDPQGDDKVSTVYNALGRVRQQSNPFRPSLGETAIYTTTAYDLAGRVISLTTPDSAVVATSYSGKTVTVSDQAGKQRKSVTDALGRLAQVYEAPNDPSYNYLTSYSYDTLDNLTSVSQGAQTRTFAYDSLKRLTLATNPESGTINYQYDSNGNLAIKTDARGVSAHYAYDALNRVARRWYNGSDSAANTVNNNPALPAGVAPSDEVNFYYDAASLPSGAPAAFERGSATGRLVAVTYGGASAGTYRGYDPLGRVVRQIQQTDSVNYLVEASYNLAGSLTGETYPSVPGSSDRRSVNLSYDAAARLSSLNSNPTSYAPGAAMSGITYAAHGAVASELYGNNLTHTISYNNRLQPSEIKLGVGGSRTPPPAPFHLTYNYGTTDNNGNVQSVAYSDDQFGFSYSQSFTYDSLNRLATATETAAGNTSWSQTNAYDRYGNRGIDLGGGNQSLSFNPTNNRITSSGYSYDAAGNLLNDGAHAYTFDAENKIKTVDGTTAYVYDGEGQRVRKLVAENLRFIYGISGQQIAEFSGSSGALQKEYVYGVSGLLATIEPTALNANGTRYLTADHLGTPRVVTNSSASVISRHDYKPFGEELAAGVGGRTTQEGYDGNDGTRQKFTQKERDIETGLDYFGARYYASTQGRFTSTDPFSPVLSKQSSTDSRAGEQKFNSWISQPQRWNRYGYALSNPLRYLDQDGEDPQEALEVLKQGLQRLESFGQLARNLLTSGKANVAATATQMALETVFGNVAFHPGGLNPAEVEFAKEVSAFEGRSFQGSGKYAQGIDGFLHDGQTPTSNPRPIELQQNSTGGEFRIMGDAGRHEQQAAGAGLKNMGLYVKSTDKNVTVASVLKFVYNGGNQGLVGMVNRGTITQVTIFTQDGVVRVEKGKITSIEKPRE